MPEATELVPFPTEPDAHPMPARGRPAARTRNEGWLAIWERIQAAASAFRQATFLFYFIFIVMWVGGLGIWIPLLKAAFGFPHPPWEDISREMATCLLAIMGGGAADLVLADRDAKSVKMLGFSLGICCVTLAIIGMGSFLPDVHLAIGASIIGSVLALLVWVLANTDNLKLSERPPPEPEAATGGPATGGAAANIAGTTAGFQV